MKAASWDNRNVAFATAFGKSQRCARPSSKARRRLIAALKLRDPFICCWCRRDLSDATVTLEHIIRIADGGTNALSNLAMACPRCNHTRHTHYWPGHTILPSVASALSMLLPLPPLPTPLLKPFNHRCYGPTGQHWMLRMKDGNGTPYCHWCQKHADEQMMAKKEAERPKITRELVT